MIVGLGSIVITLGLMIYDIRKKHLKKSEKKNHSQTIRICVTGGPCGGKSEGINMLFDKLKGITVPVFIVPEAATIIGSSGFNLNPSQYKPDEIELFQIYLMKLQLNLQNLITDAARNFIKNHDKKSVVICDRGLMDGKAYCQQENWNQILKRVNISQDQIHGRYEAVIHMVTAADGAQQHYNLGNAVRHENIECAVQLDRKILKCYNNHPNRFVITNEFIVNNFEQKKITLLAQVYQIMIKIIEENNIIDYYQNFMKNINKNTKDLLHFKINPYMQRKQRYKQFMTKQTNIK